MEPELLTVENAARMMQIGRSTLYMWIAAGLVPTFRVNGVIRIPRTALMRMIDEQVQGTASPEMPGHSTARSGNESR
jgi:excisionase family DNA binding protein